VDLTISPERPRRPQAGIQRSDPSNRLIVENDLPDLMTSGNQEAIFGFP
jgi:hypothetical protein